MYCPHCGSAVGDNALYCSHCGRPLQVASRVVLYRAVLAAGLAVAILLALFFALNSSRSAKRSLEINDTQHDLACRNTYLLLPSRAASLALSQLRQKTCRNSRGGPS
jgi:hypothetical protein